MKIKRVMLFALALLLLLPSAQAAGKKKTIQTLYYGVVSRRYPKSYTLVYEKMDTESNVLRSMGPGNKLEIVEVTPGWLGIRQGSGVGYVRRNRIDVTSNANPGQVPDFPIMPQQYYAEIDHDVEVKADKSADSETLSTLTEGARISICCIEDGWAQVIHRREYGYIDTNDLTELLPVADAVETADRKTPISVFTSFYNDNPDRIVNLARCCELISTVLQPGETMNFNNAVSPFSAANGYRLAPVLKDGETKQGYGGGSCQVSSTLWDTLMQLPGITVIHRTPHGDNAASYLPYGMDAASGTKTQNFIFRNDFDFPIRIDASTHDLALFVAIYKES